jgi:hypothetical protein
MYLSSPWGYPLPLFGYFGRKFMVFNGLRRVCVCKIFILNELRLKSSPSLSYGWLMGKAPALAGAFSISNSIVVDWVKLICRFY